MLEIKIPGWGDLYLEHLVMDYNGTLACDGVPKKGIMELLDRLAIDLKLHIVTADTFGQVSSYFPEKKFQLQILPKEDQSKGKLSYVEELGPEKCVSLGNGRNDQLMLAKSRLGLAIMLEEGVAQEAIHSADILLPGIIPALELLLNPLRLTASLRS